MVYRSAGGGATWPTRPDPTEGVSFGGEGLEQFDGDREDDGRILLGGDLRQRLQVAQLKRRRRLVDDVGRLLERT